MTTKLVAKPLKLPVSVADVRERGIVAASVSDATIAAKLALATSRLDGYSGMLGRCLITQTWRRRVTWCQGVTATAIGPIIRLPVTPVQSAIVRLVGGDGTGTPVADADVILDDDAIGPYVRPRIGSAFASAFGIAAFVEVDFVAGYGEPDDVPFEIREAIHLLAQQSIQTATGANLIRTETTEGVGSTGYFSPGEASAPLLREVDELLAPYRRMSL